MTHAEAPAKIILLGEHAVVYGRPAIAVPLPTLRARAEVEEVRGAAPGSVRLEAPDIGFYAWLHEAPPRHPLARIVDLTLQALAVVDFPPIRLRVTSAIPPASGLGSSAAVSVAVVRALAAHFRRPLTAEEQSRLAFEVEKIHHGTPSGVDNTVVAFEQPVYFRRGQPPEPFRLGGRLHLVVADTGVRASTAEAVGRVRQAWREDPERFEALFDAIGQAVESARGLLERGLVQDLGPLMDHNQELLEALGVSSPEIERLVLAAREAGALGAKLSGGGLGGNIIALTEPEAQEAVARALQGAGAARVLPVEIAP